MPLVAKYLNFYCNLYCVTRDYFNMFDERDVVSNILKGNIKSFEQLVKQYERLVFYVVNRMVTGTEDKEDICQEVFIKVHKSLPGFNFQSKLSTWIARIAYLTAVNHLKKYKNDKLKDSADNLDHYHFTNDTPELLLTKKDTSAYINALVAQLPVPYRTVLTLYHLNEFSCLEIEEITGMPQGTIKSNLFRARKLLKDKIQTDIKYEQL
jgi:RNA polymerase sigma factor (sigma-70 family)